MANIISMIEFMISQVSTYAKHVNRKSTLEAKIRNMFFHIKRNVQFPPKKEYLRCRLICGHKRLNRHINQNSLPIGLLNSYDFSDPSSFQLWIKLENCYFKNKEELDLISRTESGPKTDGISKRKGRTQSLEKSFNMSFCIRYFSSAAVLESFHYYIELIFLKLDPELLCRKFDFRCCTGGHQPECFEKWLILKHYIKVMMIEELGVPPLREIIAVLPNVFQPERSTEEKYLEWLEDESKRETSTNA
ncbi:unnamed protein product [Blepharisma stoltei]|uniref:Uncharacterized protein n=1 Tax=Blepharisma stoltei TaxID=1481888 RepID=A0AAU9JW14_9CILI|nr:unnamed protein product [Blepharisma stoltei]